MHYWLFKLSKYDLTAGGQGHVDLYEIVFLVTFRSCSISINNPSVRYCSQNLSKNDLSCPVAGSKVTSKVMNMLKSFLISGVSFHTPSTKLGNISQIPVYRSRNPALIIKISLIKRNFRNEKNSFTLCHRSSHLNDGRLRPRCRDNLLQQ